MKIHLTADQIRKAYATQPEDYVLPALNPDGVLAEFEAAHPDGVEIQWDAAGQLDFILNSPLRIFFGAIISNGLAPAWRLPADGAERASDFYRGAFAGKDLRGVDVGSIPLARRMSWLDCDMSQTVFFGANFCEGLSRVNAKGSQFTDSVICGYNKSVDFSGATFMLSSFIGSSRPISYDNSASMYSCIFADARFCVTHFIGGRFNDCDFSRAKFESCIATNASFDGSCFAGAVVSAINAKGASFKGADMRGADMSIDGHRTDNRLAITEQYEAKLSAIGEPVPPNMGVWMHRANFHEADMTGALYDDATKFSRGFDPQDAGMIYTPAEPASTWPARHRCARSPPVLP